MTKGQIKSAVSRKRKGGQGASKKPKNVATFVKKQKGGIIEHRSNMGLFGRN